ncbi:MAG: DUF2723 domain-containing protein [Chloroflexi bacterium]|nr:DUF2723 domain-containing protein [Chloroflexota bacterium]
MLLEQLVGRDAEDLRNEVDVVRREGETTTHDGSVGSRVPAAPGLGYAPPVARSRRWRARAGEGGVTPALLTSAVLFALYWWTLAPSIEELHDNVDSAELVAVASVAGVAHPPGSAIWVPLGWFTLETLTFIEEPARRTNLMSALAMALACGILAPAAMRWRPNTPVWAATAAGILAGTAPLTWAQGIVTEVLALHALLAALAIWLAPDAAQGRRWPVFALVLGLLCWDHPTGLALAVPLTAACLVRGRPRSRSALGALVLFTLPAVYSVAYLWLRADAPITWGDTSNIAGIWSHLSGEVYQGAIERSPAGIAGDLPETLRRTLAQLPPPVWLLVVMGSLAISRSRPMLGAALAITCALLIGFVSAYRVTGRQDYLATVVLIAAMVSAHGAADAWDWLAVRLPTRLARTATAAILAGLVAVWIVFVGNDISLRGDTTLRDAAVERIRMQGPGAVIETDDDADLFPLWYTQVVLGERPDVTIRDIRGDRAGDRRNRRRLAPRLTAAQSRRCALASRPRATIRVGQPSATTPAGRRARCDVPRRATVRAASAGPSPSTASCRRPRGSGCTRPGRCSDRRPHRATR